MAAPINSVTTANGTYTVGMTRAQAEKKKNYKCIMGIDFKDLDKNNNGRLERNEVLQGVIKQCDRNINSGIFEVGSGVAWAGFGVADTVCTGGLGAPIGAVQITAGVVQIADGSDKIADAKKLKKEAERQLKEIQKR